MSDSAFKTAAFPGFTTAQLRKFVADGNVTVEQWELMRTEIARRDAVADGDVEQMTDGERLRYYRKNMKR